MFIHQYKFCKSENLQHSQTQCSIGQGTMLIKTTIMGSQSTSRSVLLAFTATYYIANYAKYLAKTSIGCKRSQDRMKTNHHKSVVSFQKILKKTILKRKKWYLTILRIIVDCKPYLPLLIKPIAKPNPKGKSIVLIF